MKTNNRNPLKLYTRRKVQTTAQTRKLKPKLKLNVIKNKDVTVKNPIQKSKKVIPPIVDEEEVKKERCYDRDEWLKMEPAVMGARCLDHLTELERQRSLCSNISGIVAGKMKQSNEIVTAITQVFISKLASSGDVYTLRNENVALKAELSDLKYKDEAQAKEIEALRKMVISLEREVRSLKEGFGPFPAVASSSSSGLQSKPTRDYSTTTLTKEKRKEKTSTQYKHQDKFQSQQQSQRMGQRKDTHESDMEVDTLTGEMHGHQGAGIDTQYQEDWPSGGGTLVHGNRKRRGSEK